MKTTLMFVGDVNLRTVSDPTVPFRQVANVLKQSDVRFANLECSFYDPAEVHSVVPDGLQASPSAAEALRIAGFDVVGTANNGNYGDEPIMLTLQRLDAMGIKHTGSGANSKAAHAPAIHQVRGVRIGFLQRTSVYWPMGHEAAANRPGVAALQALTAYQFPMHRAGLKIPPPNRPGIEPEIVTWADSPYVKRLCEDIEQLRSTCDIVVASHHWGYKREVLQYMQQTAHAAIDAGASIIIGHGPHYPLPVEIYKGRPIFYSLCNFAFNQGHRALKSGNWLGKMARVVFEGGTPVEAAFRWARHNDANETYFPDLKDESASLEDITARSEAYGTRFAIEGDEVRIELPRTSADVR